MEASLNFARRFRLIDSGVLKFSKSQMISESKRYQVYHTWMSLSKLVLSKSELRKGFETNECKVKIVFGKQDKIISHTVVFM